MKPKRNPWKVQARGTAGLAILSLVVTLKVSAANEPGFVQSEFIYETAPFPSCHASTIVETPSGLVAAWFGGTAEKNPDVCIYVSRHEGGVWTPPQEVANGAGFGPQRWPTWNPVLFQPHKGPLLLFYKAGPSPSEWWGMLTTSTNAGKTWSAPRRLPEGILGPIKNKPVQLANGDILAPTSREGSDGWRVYFERSTDGGQTWTATPFLNDGRQLAAIQPSILFHGGDVLQALGRTRQGRLFDLWSQDNGKTWGPMTLTLLPNPNSGTDAVTLQDGRQLLVYNHRSDRQRNRLNVAISSDGREWAAACTLEEDPQAPTEYSYPAVIQAADGLIHITYTWQRKRIKHVVLNPNRLVLRPFTDSVWLWAK